MATATFSETVQGVAEDIREKIEDFDPEELLSVAEETARKLRSKMPVEELRGRAAECIKGQPFTAVSVAFVGGLLLGAVVGRLAGAPTARTGDSLVS
jgi:ElaB/YqjD/DUF883 family membrane-anchored ribosome-binding protein